MSHICSQLLVHAGSVKRRHRNQVRRTASSAAPYARKAAMKFMTTVILVFKYRFPYSTNGRICPNQMVPRTKCIYSTLASPASVTARKGRSAFVATTNQRAVTNQSLLISVKAKLQNGELGVCLHPGPQRTTIGAPSNLTLNVSRDGASTTSLGNLSQCLTTLIVKFFLKYSLNLPSLSLRPLLLFLSQQALLKLLAGCYKVSPQPSLLQAEQPQLSACPRRRGAPALASFSWPPLDPLQQLHVLLVLRAPELDAALQGGLTRAEQRGRTPSLALLATLRVMQPRTRLAFWAASTHCRLMSSFSSTGTPKSFSAGLLSIPSSPSLCRTLHLPLLDLMRFTQAHFSSLSRSLWMTSRPSAVSTAPLSLVSSANLLRVHSISLSMSLMRILNRTGPSTDSRGTPLVTDLHLDIEQLTATLWIRPSNQFLIH
ncbi:hypothetical protein QYF61_009330 [Mycteria americana]|uniref:Uncharacterized protein n=1 Tax=Mycteria americana TaxID=33587 RepID=A0AAN7NCE1_MYCAM|nr:hypothetical protein QYF61_009330 [Mycteria americana]